MSDIAQRSSHFTGAGEASVPLPAPARERWSWVLYDFAQTLFSMNMLTLYFTVWFVSDLGASNTLYASANAIASAMVVVALPVLGAISDARRRRKWWVVWFTVLAGIATAMVGVFGQTTVPLMGEKLIGPGAAPAGWHPGAAQLAWVALAFIVANFAFQAAQPFYNAMLPELVPAKEQGRLSGLGIAVGYIGSIVGVILVFPFFTGELPVLGPLDSGVLDVLRKIPFTSQAGRVSTFVPTAMLFMAFTVPLLLFCRDHDPAPERARVEWRAAFQKVINTLRDARRHPGALRFILTTFIYQDAAGTIVSFMTLYAIKAVGFKAGTEVLLFLVLTVPAVFGSYYYGWLSDRIGPKRALSRTLAIWVLLIGALIAVPGKTAFWIVGFAIGLNYGGIHSAERPTLLSLIPDVEAGRYFSLLLLSARTAAILGPLIWSVTVDSLDGVLGTSLAYRMAAGTVAVMFAIAWWLLRGVPDKRPGTPVGVSAA
jgi:UMF1 family MFS transporter